MSGDGVQDELWVRAGVVGGVCSVKVCNAVWLFSVCSVEGSNSVTSWPRCVCSEVESQPWSKGGQTS